MNNDNKDDDDTNQHGLIRVEVDAGAMESNNGRKEYVSSFIKNTVLKYCPNLQSNEEVLKINYSASPQGYINISQAEQVFIDVIHYFNNIMKNNMPMSLGIITLNRPQRALLYSLVNALSQDSFGLITLSEASLAKNKANGGQAIGSSLNGFIRNEKFRHVDDEVLFIQSIDQIQGEEREVILFSTLLGPRQAAKSSSSSQEKLKQKKNKKEKTRYDQDSDTNDDSDHEEQGGGDEEDDEFDPLDQLEESTGRGFGNGGSYSDSDSENDDMNEFGVTPAKHHSRHQAAPIRNLGLSYSTLAHAHGERLLNVGLTRAVRRMNVYYHPRMPAAPEHDPKPGKRSFGWLVRYLLRKPPNCPCAACASRYQRLAQDLDNTTSPMKETNNNGKYGQMSQDNLENDSSHKGSSGGGGDYSMLTTRSNGPVAGWARTMACKGAYETMERSLDELNAVNKISSPVTPTPPYLWANANSILDVGQGRFKVDVALSISALQYSSKDQSKDQPMVTSKMEMEKEEKDDDVDIDESELERNTILKEDISFSPIERLSIRLLNKRIAMLCCEYNLSGGGDGIDVRERCSVVPMILGEKKLGWDGCIPFSSLTVIFKPLLKTLLSKQHLGLNDEINTNNNNIFSSLQSVIQGAKITFSDMKTLISSPQQIQRHNNTSPSSSILLSLQNEDNKYIGTLPWISYSCEVYDKQRSTTVLNSLLFDKTKIMEFESNLMKSTSKKKTKRGTISTTNTATANIDANEKMISNNLNFGSEEMKELLETLNKLKVTELKLELKQRGLIVSGRKADLVNRLGESMMVNRMATKTEQNEEEEEGASDGGGGGGGGEGNRLDEVKDEMSSDSNDEESDDDIPIERRQKSSLKYDNRSDQTCEIESNDSNDEMNSSNSHYDSVGGSGSEEEVPLRVSDGGESHSPLGSGSWGGASLSHKSPKTPKIPKTPTTTSLMKNMNKTPNLTSSSTSSSPITSSIRKSGQSRLSYSSPLAACSYDNNDDHDMKIDQISKHSSKKSLSNRADRGTSVNKKVIKESRKLVRGGHDDASSDDSDGSSLDDFIAESDSEDEEVSDEISDYDEGEADDDDEEEEGSDNGVDDQVSENDYVIDKDIINSKKSEPKGYNQEENDDNESDGQGDEESGENNDDDDERDKNNSVGSDKSYESLAQDSLQSLCDTDED
mmetsp:Transcript_45265/g.58007  ORF Transcript_45265/g.58007 Transcript_45265/m.58007 type:complete len:1176 (-) Transcript_45265:197-3724(-)